MAATTSTDSKSDTSSADAPELHRRNFWATVNPGYIVAGLAALWKAGSVLSRDTYKAFDENGRFDELNKKIKDAFHEAYEEYRLTDEDNKILADAIKREQTHKGSIRKAQEKIVTKIKKFHGINWVGDDLIRAKPHQKLDAILTFTTVASIALGAIYSFSRERGLTEKLNKQIKQNVDQQKDQQFILLPAARDIQSAPSAVARREKELADRQQSDLGRSA